MYLITLASNDKNILDIIETSQLEQDIIRKNCPLIVGIALGYTDALDLVREITKQAFEMGAKDVIVHFDDAEINHLRALYCDEETLKEVPEWKKESLDYYLRQDAVQMGVNSSYPTLNEDVPSEKLLAQGYSSNEVRNVVRKHIHAGNT